MRIENCERLYGGAAERDEAIMVLFGLHWRRKRRANASASISDLQAAAACLRNQTGSMVRSSFKNKRKHSHM